MFENCYELREAFRVLLQRPDKLLLTTGEHFPAIRPLSGEVDATEMTGVEHLGQYVYDMTQAKLDAIRAGESVVLAGTDAVAADATGLAGSGNMASDADVDKAIPDVEQALDDDEEEFEDEEA